MATLYQIYLESDHWKALKEECFTAAKYKCEVCNSSENLQGHHLIYRTPLTLCYKDDIMCICRKCHYCLHLIKNISDQRRVVIAQVRQFRKIGLKTNNNTEILVEVDREKVRLNKQIQKQNKKEKPEKLRRKEVRRMLRKMKQIIEKFENLVGDPNCKDPAYLFNQKIVRQFQKMVAGF